jgi:hypothetical protein
MEDGRALTVRGGYRTGGPGSPRRTAWSSRGSPIARSQNGPDPRPIWDFVTDPRHAPIAITQNGPDQGPIWDFVTDPRHPPIAITQNGPDQGPIWESGSEIRHPVVGATVERSGGREGVRRGR